MGVHSHDIVVVSANEVEDLLASIAWLDVGFDAAQMAAARDTFSFYTSVPAKWK